MIVVKLDMCGVVALKSVGIWR